MHAISYNQLILIYNNVVAYVWHVHTMYTKIRYYKM